MVRAQTGLVWLFLAVFSVLIDEPLDFRGRGAVQDALVGELVVLERERV